MISAQKIFYQILCTTKNAIKNCQKEIKWNHKALQTGLEVQTWQLRITKKEKTQFPWIKELKVAVNGVMLLNLVRFCLINYHFQLKSMLPFCRCHHQFHYSHKLTSPFHPMIRLNYYLHQLWTKYWYYLEYYSSSVNGWKGFGRHVR